MKSAVCTEILITRAECWATLLLLKANYLGRAMTCLWRPLGQAHFFVPFYISVERAWSSGKYRLTCLSVCELHYGQSLFHRCVVRFIKLS